MQSRRAQPSAPAPSPGAPQSGSASAARKPSDLRRVAAARRRHARAIPDLRPGERVVVLLRRHPFVLGTSLIWPGSAFVGWAVALAIFAPLVAGLQTDPVVDPSGPSWIAPLFWVLAVAIAIGIVLWAAYAVLDWLDDWVALTTRRVIFMDKALFFRESRREAPLGKVQNVITEYPNALGMALDFGDIKVDTSGAGTLSFQSAPHPKVLREAIFGQQKVLAQSQPPPEDRRREAVRAIVLGQVPSEPIAAPIAQRPGPLTTQSKVVSGFGMLNSLFPVAPQRSGALVVWHRHWAYAVYATLVPLLSYAAVLAGWLLSVVLGQPGVVGPVETALGWLALILLPICAAAVLWKWEDWRNDIYKLDHERVYHIESLPFGLREQSRETLITRITDVMYVVSGPVANLLNYGNVVIKTPGEAAEFVFEGIPCPREVQKEIMERVDEYRQKAAAGDDREIEAWLKAYHDITGESGQP